VGLHMAGLVHRWDEFVCVSRAAVRWWAWPRSSWLIGATLAAPCVASGTLPHLTKHRYPVFFVLSDFSMGGPRAMNFWWGALGAFAPEIVRWVRITRSETPAEWRRISYWLATTAYIALGGLLAVLIAQPVGGAAFSMGVATEFVVLGAISVTPGSGTEEFVASPATRPSLLLVGIQQHATYLRSRGR